MSPGRRLAVVAALVTASAGGVPAVLPAAAAIAVDVPPAPADAPAAAAGAPPAPIGPLSAPAVLLQQSAAASEQLAYTGTKYVAVWRPTATTSALVDVRHDAGGALSVRLSSTAAPAEQDGLVLVRSELDGTLLGVLQDSYDLQLAGTARCTGRDADVVEARRPGTGIVVARFWIDRQTRLLLRREVYDDSGRRVRSSAFVDLQVQGAPAVSTVAVAATSTPPGPAAADAGEPVPPAELDRLRAAGWPLPEALPGGFVLFDARSRTHGAQGRVLHLAYTDGLSTTSLFVQSGRLGAQPPAGFQGRTVSGRSVWVHDGAPERLVWSGHSRVLTLVSDAPDGAVAAAVAALPHDPMPAHGLLARLDRGAHRLVSWLNPFA